jgi:hypothetical protein
MEKKYIDSLIRFISNLSQDKLKLDKFDIYNLWSQENSFEIRDINTILLLTDLIDEVKITGKSVNIKKYL